MKSKLASAIGIVLAIAIPVISFAASFGTQNFFYAPGNVITPLAGFTTSWGSGGSGFSTTSASYYISQQIPWTISQGGTATTTGGNTGGIEVYDGSKITNYSGFAYSQSTVCPSGAQWAWNASSTLSNALTLFPCPQTIPPYFTFTTSGRFGIGTTSPTGLFDVDQGNASTPSIKLTLTAAANTNELFLQQVNGGGDGANSHALFYEDDRGSNPFLFFTHNGSTSGTSNAVVINNFGQTAFGTTTPYAELTVMSGTVAFGVTQQGTSHVIATSTDNEVIAVTSLGSPASVTLPLCTATSTVGALTTGYNYTIKDEGGGAGSNNVTISAVGGQLIDAASTKVISTNYGVAHVYCDGGISGGRWFTE